MLSVCTVCVSADENIGTIKADRITAKAGDEITVPVSLIDHQGVFIIRVTVKYDAKVVELKNVVKSAEDQFNYTVNDTVSGQVIVLMDGKNLYNVEEDVKLFELKFKVKADAPSGRSLFPVICEEGMATMLINDGEKLDSVSFSPSTSTGSLTVLCNEHIFDITTDSGTKQCSKCGAVKDSGGNVSVDSMQGLPEIDIATDSSDNNSSSDENNLPESTDSLVNSGESQSEDGDGGINFLYFLPLIAAVLIVGGFFTVKYIKKKQN